jgi:hypothetical protein
MDSGLAVSVTAVCAICQHQKLCNASVNADVCCLSDTTTKTTQAIVP